MRGRNDRQGASVRNDARYARSERPVRGRSIGWLTSLLLLVSLLAPYATVQTSLASPMPTGANAIKSLQQRNNTPPPLEGVFSVTVGGDVAQLVGNIALSPSGDGMWIGSASLGPGTYSFQLIVATNTGAVTLGQDGLQSPPANQATFTVPDGSQAAIFAFNEATGAVNAGGALFEILTDVGQFQMLPAPQGTYEVFFNSPADTPITIQPLLLGSPTGETAQATAGDSARIHVVLNSAGQIQTAEAVQTATLDIIKTDQNGNPLPGACFTAYGGGDSVAGQACDTGDGSSDGSVRISFANGLPNGNVDLVESFTPEGQPQSESQSIDLNSGAQQIQMIAQVEGEEPPAEEPPAEEPPVEETPIPEQPSTEGGFTLTFFAVDLNGNALPGACFAIDGAEPICDDDGDGSVVIPNVQPGTRTLSEPRSPEGFEAYPEIQLQISRDEQFSVPHNPGVSAQLPEDTSTINLQSVDENGNILPGACYQIDTGVTACDDDGDGVVTFENLPNGTYNVAQTQTPAGAQPLNPFQLEVNGDATLQVPHQATAIPEEPEVPVGYTIGFVSVDENQNGLPFACYNLDGGDPVCDEDGDGVVTFQDVQPGLHTLTQTQAPDGYDNVGSVEVNVEQDANFAVRHTASAVPEEPEPTPTQTEEPSGLTVGFVSVDQDDNGLPGACFTLDGGEEVCDDDGDAEVTFTGVQPGAHTLTQTRAPDGYDNVGSLDLDLQNDGRFAVRHQQTAVEEPEQPAGNGQIVARTIDQDGNALPEVCYELSGFGQQCDGDDEDSDMTQDEVPAGEYTVALVVPEGYEVVGESSRTITVVAGEATEVEFQVQVAGEPPAEETPVPPVEGGAGAIAAIAVEEGFPILDACIAFEGPASGEVCDNQTGDADPAQGSILIPDLPAGSYQVAMPNPPAGFDPAPAVTADVTDGGVAQVQLQVGGEPQEPQVEETPAAETGNLSIFKVDPDGSPLAGACFQIGDASPVCDNAEGDADGLEGVVRIEGIPAGDQFVTETTAPEGYELAQPGTVNIPAGDDIQVQVINEPIQQALGSFRVLKRQPDETRIPGSCFAITATDGTVLGPWCDDDASDNDDRVGVMEILDIPVGEYILTETTVPEGYVGSADVTFTVTEGERASITVYNDFATGTVVIAKVDQNGAALGGACFLVGETEYCDDAQGDINGEPGIIQIEGLTVGSVTISESSAPQGYSLVTEPQTIDVVANGTASASFVNQPLAGSLLISKTDESGEFLSGACFQVGEAEICDNGEGDESPDAGTILVTGLPAGELTIAETVAPAGYAIADEPQSVEIVADDTVGLDFADRLLSGTIVIRKTDDAGTALGGACFSVGGQEVCDNGAGDLNAEDGVIEMTGIPAGDIEVSETAAPAGYAGAADPQTVNVTDGSSAEVSFINTRQIGNLRIEKTDEAGAPLAGSCFVIGDAEICDNGEGDANPDDGVIEVTGLGAGPIDVVETATPAGYIGADSQTVEVPANDTVAIVVVNTRQTGTIEISTASEGGSALGGACYLVNDIEVCDGQEGDGNGDAGIISVSGVPTGDVLITQTLAPEGFGLSAEPQTVPVAADETTEVDFGSVALVGGLRIEKVDENGSPVGGACFAVGAQRVCDNDGFDENGDDGVIQISGLPIGPIGVSETSVPEGYDSDGISQSLQILADQVVTTAFVNTRLTGAVRIDKVDQDGAPLGGACFSVGEQQVCDDDAGDANPEPGVIEISGVPVGTVNVSETSAPERYAADGTTQTVDVAAGETSTITMVNTVLLGGVRIEKVDESGNLLGGACFTFGGSEVCDNGEGDTNGDDGIVEVGGIPVGPVDVIETSAPEGYASTGGTTVQVTADEVISATVTNVRLVGSVRIVKIDENGAPLGGACFSIAGTEVCDNGDGDLNPDAGVIDIGSVPTGSVDVIETTSPDGYVAADPVTVDVAADSVSEVQVANARALGSVQITKTDQDGNPLAGACFTIGDAGEICDNGEGDANGDDGVIEVGGIPSGSVAITESTTPDGYAAGESTTVDVTADGVAAAEFVNVRLVGGVRILKTDQNGDPLGGACFTIAGTEVCDNGDGDLDAGDGVIEVNAIPTGSVEIVETTAPAGYLIADPVTVDVTADTTIDVTVVNALATGSVVITKTDQDGSPLEGACFTVGDASEVCDSGEGDLNDEGGTIEVGSVPAGTVNVVESSAPEGYAAAADQTVEVFAGEAAVLTMSNERLTGSLIISKVDGDGTALGGACFTVGASEVCDDGDGDANDAPGVIQVSGIPTGSVDVTESTVPDGYAGAEPQTAQITADEPASLSFVNTRLTGGVTINKNNDNGDPLGGACFTIGEIEVCDNDTTDLNEAEGVIEVDGVPTGPVDVTETSAPEGYAVAAPQSVDVAQDERATITVVNTLLTGSVQILKTDENGEPLSGSCFLVDGQEICDGGEGDENEADGAILVSEIEIGPIVVSETVAPEGYALAADAQTVEIQTDEVVDVTFVNAFAVGIVSISKTDENGEPIAGACFTIGETQVCDNQDGDVNPADGQIDVTRVPVGTVVVTESVAPADYIAAADPQSVELGEGETVAVTFVNTLAVGTLIIAKTDDAGEPVGGACFAIDDGTPVCDNGDGDENGDEGTIEIASVPVGSRSVAESQAPEGYVGAADPQTVEIVLGEAASVEFVNQLAIGTIRILKTAEDTGDPLGGACFTIDDGDPVCDNGEGDGDAAPGVISITARVGEHTVVETQTPEGYDLLTPATTVNVVLGESVDVPFVNTRFTGSLSLTKTDNLTGEYLAGACFTLDGETPYGPACDNGDGDADPATGVILLQGIEPGVYSITESTTPEGFVAPDGPVAEGVVIAGGTITSLEFENEPDGVGVRPILPPVGTLEITSLDEEGNPVGGACFGLTGATEVGPVCDNDAADLEPETGIVRIGDIPTGEYTLAETTTPGGFTPSSPRTVFIGLEATVEVEIVHSATPAEPGSLRIRTLDTGGNPVGGGCFSWSTGSQCDNLAGDGDPAVGVILVTGIVAGEYTVTGTEPPVGMVLADPQTVTIASGEEATLEFTHEAAAEETGGLEFQLEDDSGTLVPGACVALSESSNAAEDLVFCDGGDEDTNPDPGVLTIENLPVGTYSVSQAAVQGADSAAVSGVSFKMQIDGQPTLLQAASEKTVQVKPNVIIVVIIIIIIEPPQTGGLDVVKRSEDTNVLQPGACFQVTGQGNDIEICDNDGLDTNLTQGVVRFVNLPEGLYTVTETKSPPGYDPDENSDVAIVGGVVTTITFRNPPTVDPVGDLTVLKVNPDGDPVTGTCFELRDGAVVVAGPICDVDDGADDGSIVFTDIEPGNYALRETQAASSDYQPIPDQPVTIVAGQNTEIPVVNTLKPGSILITKLDDEGNGPLAGACFGLDRGSGIEFQVCDQQMGDGDLEEGIILIKNVPPGEYDLVETQAPAGFDPGPAIPVTVNPATQLLLEVENTPSIPPTDTGDLTIIKRNQKGEPLPGACFALRQGAVIKVAPRCDGDDGNLDGRIVFTDVGVGQYGIIETKKPSADYQTPPEKFVTITKDQAIDIIVVNVLKAGRIQITKVNQQNQPLANACFTVSPGYFAQKCTNGLGVVVFDNLPPGVYTVTETQAPYGYLAAPAVTNVVVKPGLTTPVKIINQKAPPPADAGSLRVIKFFCPLLGNSQELWSVYDSSDANQKTLAQTANCKKGDATFVLKPTAPGDLVSIKFVTGADGIAHLTLKAGTYTLTELGTGVTTQVEVFVSQQTTVVVLNYVKPPTPGPAAINVYKFTCDPGFQGQFYLDFIGACGATENLTNNVTFRISGASVATGVTGDGGQRGRTLFTQLPSGLYLLREETPTGSGQVYMWCGLQIDSYEYGAIGNQIAFPLQAGQTMWCAAFNVPDLVTDTTGSLVVQKYACELPPVKRPANFDWFAECGLQTTGAKFGLSELVDGQYVPKLTGLTNVNGLLTFDGLKPGTYKLQEIGGDWCHAESDAVNATGDVVIRAGQRANVWIFNCIPTVGPPNTGAGTTAGHVPMDAAIGRLETSSVPAGALLMWPVLALLGFAARHRWSRSRAA